MGNQTAANIREKRRIRRRYRRRQFFRLLLFLTLMGIIGWSGYHIANWGGEICSEYYRLYQDYQARRESHRTALDAQFESYLNVLFIGLDEGYGSEGPEADSFLLLSLDKKAGRLRVLSVPRGTLLMTATGETEKISHIYRAGGAEGAVGALRGLLGVTIHYYMVINPQILAEIIDALDGIEIYVEIPMDYEDPEVGLAIHLPQGYQRMNGDMVQKYLRYRGGELGDIGRVQRQHRFMKAMHEKLLRLDTVPKLPQLGKILQVRVTTSAELWDSAHLPEIVKSLSPEVPEAIMLPGRPAAWDETAFVPDMERLQHKLEELFPPDAEQAAEKNG